jgi:hypothetical protein
VWQRKYISPRPSSRSTLGGLGPRRAHPRTLPHLHGHARQRRCELLRDAQPPAMMIAVDDASGIAIALSRGWQHHKRCCEGCGTAPCWSACRPSGRADLLGFGRIEHLGRRWLPSSACLGIRGRRAGSVAELAGRRAVRLGAAFDLRYHRPADRGPRRRATRSAAAQAGEKFRGRAACPCWGWRCCSPRSGSIRRCSAAGIPRPRTGGCTGSRSC